MNGRNLFRSGPGRFFDIHAPFRADYHHRFPCKTIHGDSYVQLLHHFDLLADHYLVYFQALDVGTQHLSSLLFQFISRFCHFNSTGQPTPSHKYLGFDHYRIPNLTCCAQCFFGGFRYHPSRHGNAGFFENIRGFILL